MTYFKIRTVHLAWLDMEIAKGKIFYHKSNPPVQEWVPCGAYRENGFSYDRLTAQEVSRMIKKDKNVYWRN